jgi:DNA-binding response OmpR family regulator
MITDGAGRSILVVEDDHKIADVVRIYLERDGFHPILAVDGQEALQLVDSEQPALIVLDLLLPGLDGREVCRLIRLHSQVPIIMLTALSTERDTLHGLGLGADDYITKPFSPRELLARIHTVLRRSRQRQTGEGETLAIGGLLVLPDRYCARLGDTDLSLTPAEFALLVALMREPGRTLSRQQLIDAAFGDDFDGFERTVDTHIKNLRRKLADVGAPATPAITTVYGVGYSLRAP